jgi:uncharacterized repeat protein (TIGR01451 family)
MVDMVAQAYVIPHVGTAAEYLIEMFCSMGEMGMCFTINDLLGLGIEGSDVMVFVGHWAADPSGQIMPEWFWEQVCVTGGLLEVINGRITGAWYQHYLDGDMLIPEKVVSFLGGTYCSSMHAEAGLEIDPRWLDDDWVTVKQLPIPEPETDADIEITKEVDGSTEIEIGGETTFVLSATNHGPVAATGVVVSDVLPAGVNYVDHEASLDTWYDVTSGMWHIGDLGVDQTVSLDIDATVNAVGDISNVAMIAVADQPDPDTSNNADQAVVTGIEADAVDYVDLDEGWNFISLPIIPEDNNIEEVLDVVAGDVITVNYYTGGPQPPGVWLLYSGEPLIDDLLTMEDGKGYWMEMDDSGMITYSGYVISKPPPEVPPYYEVIPGWNAAGFKSVVPQLAEDYLASIAGKYIVIYGYEDGEFFIVGSPGHEYLQPGLGYWIAVILDGTIFPPQ